VPERQLRILGIGDGRSLNFLRWGRRLRQRGHDVHIVSGRISESELDGLVAHDVRELEPLTRIPGVRRLRVGSAIAALGRELEVDLVHAHYLLPYGYWAARADLHPLVMSPWSRDIFVDAEKGRGRRRALAAIKAADYFVSNSKANERTTASLGGDPSRMREIIWYAEPERFRPEKADPELRARLGWPDDALVVLSLRNYRPYTNLDVLVRAFARVADDEPKAHLLLCARGGPTKPDLEALVDERGLRDRVAFHRAEHAELPAIVASGDLAVTIADTDSTPASLLETMASRLAVVCGHAPSMDEWVSQGEGAEMVDPHDEDAVAAALARLLADPELRRRYGERNERYVRERLGDPAEALESLYFELLAAGR